MSFFLYLSVFVSVFVSVFASVFVSVFVSVSVIGVWGSACAIVLIRAYIHKGHRHKKCFRTDAISKEEGEKRTKDSSEAQQCTTTRLPASAQCININAGIRVVYISASSKCAVYIYM